jgi:hypothetical protein
LVFIFLKSFGKNEFAVTPLFQDSMVAPTDCNAEYNTPYTIADSVLAKIQWSKEDSVFMVVFYDFKEGNQQELLLQINRILKEVKDPHLRVLSISVENSDKGIIKNGTKNLFLANAELATMMNCIFLLKKSDNTIVIDSKKRIAGQYNLLDREDSDRLILELKILLKKY